MELDGTTRPFQDRRPLPAHFQPLLHVNLPVPDSFTPTSSLHILLPIHFDFECHVYGAEDPSAVLRRLYRHTVATRGSTYGDPADPFLVHDCRHIVRPSWQAWNSCTCFVALHKCPHIFPYVPQIAYPFDSQGKYVQA